MSILACFRHLVSKMECESEIKRTIFVMELKCGLINLGKVEKKGKVWARITDNYSTTKEWITSLNVVWCKSLSHQ